MDTKRDTYLKLKERGQGIRTSKFPLPFGRLNLLSLFLKNQAKVIKKSCFTIIKVVEIFEYGKNNDEYWDGVKLH